MDTTTKARPEIIALLGTPGYATETRSDFTDLVARPPVRRVDRSDSVRIVKGADDLTRPATSHPMGFDRVPQLRDELDNSDQTHVPAYISPAMRGVPEDRRTDAQRNLMTKLVNELGGLDIDLGVQALEYTVKMTDSGRWTPGREGTASVWIGRLIAKVRELNANRPVATPDYVGQPSFINANPGGLGTVGDTLPADHRPHYYAVEIGGDVKFYRVKRGTKSGMFFIDVQASDEFHSIRNVATKRAIIAAIEDLTPAVAMANYGQLIGSCGRCHITLTDATSRALGIGPDCRAKL